MIPITQTKVVVKNSKGEMVVRGNCFAAAIASLLEVPIYEVPNVETLFDVEDVSWYGVMQAWLRSKGYELETNPWFGKVFHSDGVSELLKEEYIENLEYCKDKYYLVSAMSPRGVYHVCIYQNGKLVHDPHPTREGIDESTISYFEEIVKINHHGQLSSNTGC